MGPTFWAAMRRSVLPTVGAFALALLLGLQRDDGLGDAAIDAGIIALAPLVGRGIVEGVHDQRRANTNDQNPADVGFDRLANR